jgi:mRNA interferase HigB
MHIISYRRLREFSKQHADCREALDNWYKVVSKASWSNLIEIQSIFPKAEAVSNFTVFKGINLSRDKLYRGLSGHFGF